jgi:hypothetical protein
MSTLGYEFYTIQVTPTVTAAAYSANNQVGGIQTLTKACYDVNRFSELAQLTITDKGAQSAALSILLFDQLPTVASSDKVAFDITDAEVAGKCIGNITIAATDYVATASNSVACKTFALPIASQNNAGNLYAVVKTTGTPTYASTSDLTFKWVFRRGY